MELVLVPAAEHLRHLCGLSATHRIELLRDFLLRFLARFALPSDIAPDRYYAAQEAFCDFQDVLEQFPSPDFSPPSPASDLATLDMWLESPPSHLALPAINCDLPELLAFYRELYMRLCVNEGLLKPRGEDIARALAVGVRLALDEDFVVAFEHFSSLIELDQTMTTAEFFQLYEISMPPPEKEEDVPGVQTRAQKRRRKI